MPMDWKTFNKLVRAVQKYTIKPFAEMARSLESYKILKK